MLVFVMTNFGFTRIFLGAVGATALSALAFSAVAGAEPSSDADLAKSVGCGYAGSVEQAAHGSNGYSLTSKVISERNGVFVVECAVNALKPQPQGAGSYVPPGPPSIYRVTVDANNRFFVTRAEGPSVPSVRAPRAVV